MKKISVLVFLCYSFAANAQTIVGKVIDAETREPLISASVYYKNYAGGTMTNVEGEFVINRLADNDTLCISYIGYASQRLLLSKLPDIIALKKSEIQLAEVTVVPVGVILKQVWEKYNKIYKAEQKNKNKKQYTFFYRQTTRTDSLYNEFIESFFTGTNSYAIDDLKLEKGRYARWRSDSIFTFSLENAFALTQMNFFRDKNPKEKEKKYNLFLQPNTDKIYHIKLDNIIESEDGESIYVIDFQPKDKNLYVIYGKLYIRKSDLAVVKLITTTDKIGISDKSYKKQQIVSTVNYVDNEEVGYPMVKSVKNTGYFELWLNFDNKLHTAVVNSTIFLTDYNTKSTGKKIKFQSILIEEIRKQKYDAEFWRNNPIVKRTKIEEEIIKDFENKNVFGNFQP